MSTRARRATVAALAAVVLVLGALVVVAALRGVQATPAPAKLDNGPIEVLRTLTPREPQFGDPLTARIRVAVDSARIDPESVQVRTSVAPYRAAGWTRRVRRLQGIAVVELTTTLRCLSAACVPAKAVRRLNLPAITVAYRAGGQQKRLFARWPALLVHGRVLPADIHQPTVRVGNPTAVSPAYRFSPRLTGWVLLGLAALLGLAGLTLVVRALRRAGLLFPRPVETALARALRELDDARLSGDGTRQRLALDHLATELTPLDESLAFESRVLAWAPFDPRPEDMSDIAVRVGDAARR